MKKSSKTSNSRTPLITQNSFLLGSFSNLLLFPPSSFSLSSFNFFLARNLPALILFNIDDLDFDNGVFDLLLFLFLQNYKQYFKINYYQMLIISIKSKLLFQLILTYQHLFFKVLNNRNPNILSLSALDMHCCFHFFVTKK